MIPKLSSSPKNAPSPISIQSNPSRIPKAIILTLNLYTALAMSPSLIGRRCWLELQTFSAISMKEAMLWGLSLRFSVVPELWWGVWS